MVEKIKKLYTKELSYDEVKKIVENIVVDEMKDIVENKYKVRCVIVDNLEENVLAYTKSFTEIGISSEVIKRILKKDKLAFAIILHELEKVTQAYQIYLGLIDTDIEKIIKEDIILSNNDEWKTLKTAKSYYIKEHLFRTTSDTIANNIAYIDLYCLFNEAEIFFTEEEEEQIKNSVNMEKNDKIGINYVKINDNIIELEEYFDQFIYYNPKWLYIYPQLQIEYFINDDGFVEKRNNYNLKKFSKDNSEDDETEYMKYLLNKSRKIKKYS